MGQTDTSKHNIAQLVHTRALQVLTVCILVLVLLTQQVQEPYTSTVEGEQLPAASADTYALSLPTALPVATATSPLQLSTKSREWFLTHPSLHCARHEIVSKGRVSQSPFASGDTFRSMADHVLDDYTDKPGADWRPSDVKQGDIIFVKVDFLPKFFKDWHPHINVTYILISHNGAFAVPVDKRSKCKADKCSRYLKDPKLGHWYGKNMLPGFGPKTTPLPIGLASSFYPHGDHNALLTLAKSAPAWASRPTSIYIAMKNETNSVRSYATAQLSSLPGVQLVAQRVNYTTYLRQVANSKFVAAPPGYGIDTHRAFEAIYLGAVPIIQKGPLDHLYEGLPVLLVDEYRNVTTSLLVQYGANRATHYNTERAWAIYWYQEFKHRQRLIRAAAAASQTG